MDPPANRVRVNTAATAPAAEVDPGTLRRADGELRTVRKPVEMAVLEPRTRRITLWSRKAWLLLVSYSLNTEAAKIADGMVWRIPLRTLMRDASFSSRDHAHIKESIRECQRTLVEWSESVRDPRTGEVRTWASSQLLGSVEFVTNAAGRECIEWSLPPTLLKELRAYQHYYMLSLNVVAEIGLNSTLSLYEIVCRYRSNPSGLTMRRPWQEWVPVLTGESDESARIRSQIRYGKQAGEARERYGEFRYFNRDVVQKAVRELNAVQDEFLVEPVLIKEGRAVKELQFRIHHRKGFVAARGGELSAQEQSAVDSAVGVGVNEKVARSLVRQYGGEQLRAGVEQAGQASGLQNPAGFVVAQVRAQARAGDAAPGPAAAPTRPQPTPEEGMRLALEDFRASRVENAKAHWPEVPVEVQEDYLRRFEAFARERFPYLLRDFTATGLKKPIVRANFFQWLAETMANESGPGWTPSAEQLVAHLVAQAPPAPSPSAAAKPARKRR
ncbi:replication initiation protein [Azohydromonas aeria]|uniref:replication initiation protein n=1 Tax=Azohydromonas aeria TaxID=2590212 RepID=UPI0012F9AE29|nr:replication initiation protein [Azohydromonas aeria]